MEGLLSRSKTKPGVQGDGQLATYLAIPQNHHFRKTIMAKKTLTLCDTCKKLGAERESVVTVRMWVGESLDYDRMKADYCPIDLCRQHAKDMLDEALDEIPDRKTELRLYQLFGGSLQTAREFSR